MRLHRNVNKPPCRKQQGINFALQTADFRQPTPQRAENLFEEIQNEKFHLSFSIVTMLISLSAYTVGARGHLKFSEAKDPISLSPALYDQYDNVLIKDKQLNVVGKFKYEKRFWGLMYSWVRISESKDVDEAINDAIEKTR